MKKAVILFRDEHVREYSDVMLDHENRIVLIQENNEIVGFIPYEAILVFSWIEEEKEREEVSE